MNETIKLTKNKNIKNFFIIIIIINEIITNIFLFLCIYILHFYLFL